MIIQYFDPETEAALVDAGVSVATTWLAGHANGAIVCVKRARVTPDAYLPPPPSAESGLPYEDRAALASARSSLRETTLDEVVSSLDLGKLPVRDEVDSLVIHDDAWSNDEADSRATETAHLDVPETNKPTNKEAEDALDE